MLDFLPFQPLFKNKGFTSFFHLCKEKSKRRAFLGIYLVCKNLYKNSIISPNATSVFNFFTKLLFKSSSLIPKIFVPLRSQKDKYGNKVSV